ncbi:unnamed protein product (macronuclear) [Paramecium tetraurelia]|uniref:Transmembrane protein n=1 Tax=Paramecium tetraurelia TaxID=5888 RepID=A0CV36_PARTE|nr:uncharacterized protein GSPATT00010821001 [Paramecium tetraurelia]CAK74653.1 unnamed protein product [Paramecium tetraurelia]|eukprot:XP_001442050.1 hypothetical protein (macronuclear) [Paramecium tetraurelia strain d4-2]
MITKESQTKSINIKMIFYERILQLYYFSSCKEYQQYIVIILGEIQYLTFLWVPNIKSHQIGFYDKSINFQAFAIYFTRIDQLTYFQFGKSQTFYLIALMTQLLLFVMPIVLLITIKHKQQVFQYTLLKLFFALSSIYCQIFIITMFVPFSIFCVDSLLINIDTPNAANYTNIFFICLTFGLLFLFGIILSILCKETIDLKKDRFQKLNQTFLDYVQLILFTLQIIVYGVIAESYNAQILQCILIITISLIKILQIFQFQYTNNTIINLILIISSFGLTQSILYLIYNINESNFSQNANSIILLLFLVVSKVLIEIYTYQEKVLCNNIMSIKQQLPLKYFFTKLINEHFNQTQKRILNAVITNGLVKQQEQVEELAHFSNYDTNFLSPQSMEQFVTKKMKQYAKVIQKNKGYDLHYIALLYKYGLTNLALNQINNLLNSFLNQSKSKGFLIDSENYSKGQDSSSRQMHHQTISSKSIKSNSDDVNDIARKNNQQRSKHQLSQIETSRALLLKNQIKAEIQVRFFENNKMKTQINDVQLGVELFLKNEKRNQNLKNTLLMLINEKIKFLSQFTNKKILDSDKIFNLAKDISNLQLKVENKLFQRYQSFPSRKIQSILTFYQAEILNNFIEAFKYKALTSMPDEQLINMDSNIRSTFFTKKVVYLNITLEDNQTLSIQRRSENALRFFQIHSDDTKQFSNVEYILPIGIQNEHSLLVQRFIQTSKSKFYLNSNQTFFRYQNILMKTCQFIFDIHFDSVSHYKFSAFFSESVNQSAYILVDINHLVGGLTESFFEKMGFNEKTINQINSVEDFYLPIDLLIPSFKKLIDSNIQSAITELRFVKEAFFNRDEYDRKQKRQQSMTSTNWSQLEKLYIFDAELIIQYFEIYGYYYYIIEVKDLKQQFNSKKSIGQSSRNKALEGLEHFFELSDLSENEAVANSPKAFRAVNSVKLNDEMIRSGDEIEINKIQNAQPIQILQPDYISFQEPNILSPNVSNTPWQDSSQIPLQFNNQQSIHQQDYFNKQKDISISVNDSKIVNNQDEFDDDNNRRASRKNVEQNILKRKKIMQGEEESSSNNVLKGIKKSQFYKKYEMILQLVEPIYPNTLKLFILFQELTYFISLTYFLIILVGVQNDLNRFIGEIDMIQLHAGVMNPHDLYLQMRQTIFTYQGFLGQGKLTQEQYNQLSNPLYENIAIGYYEFKDGFIYWLSNDYLTPFFKDKNITAYYMLYDATKTYGIVQNIREALMATLSYYYQFKLRFESRLSPANQTYQIYQFANVYNFHFWLEDLTLEVLAYSKNRSVETSNKWNLIWIIYLLIGVCPLLSSIYYYRIYRLKFDKYTNLFRYCSSYKMDLEIEKLKSIIKIMNKNTESLYNYQFSIDNKEDNILKEKQKSDHDQLKAKDIKVQQQLKNLSFFSGFFLIIFGWLVFLALSIVANIQIADYLDKYTATADTYKLLQDMTLYAGTLFRNRDFGLNFPNLPYLRDFDREKFYVTMYTGLDTISTFLEFSYTFDSTKYQVSQDFLDFFLQIQQNDVCTTIGDDTLGFLTQYCDKSLQGSLNQGLTQTLKFIYSTITVQMEMNNFTKRIEYNWYENEGGLIVMRATQIMSKQFKAGMVNVTNQQITISNSISIIYMIYSILLMLYFVFYLLPKLQKELLLVRRFILLIPTSVLFLDDQFDRHVRIIIAGQEY